MNQADITSDDAGSGRRCRLCGSGRVKSLRPVRGQRTREDIPVVRCRSCGHFSTFPRTYQADKSFDWEGIDYYLKQKHSSLRHSRATLTYLLSLLGRRPDRPKMLDVGCGMGLALVSARELGIDAVGLDPERRIASYGRSHFGVEILIAKLETHDFGGETFDLIYLEQVLEHVAAPFAFLELAKKRLRPGGMIYVGVPPVNLANRVVTSLLIGGLGLTALSNPLADIFFDPEEHINCFTGQSITCLAERLRMGLRFIDTREYLKFPGLSLSSREKFKYLLRSAGGPRGMGQFVLHSEVRR